MLAEFLVVLLSIWCLLSGSVLALTALDTVPDEKLLPFRAGTEPGIDWKSWDDVEILCSRAGFDGQRIEFSEECLEENWDRNIDVCNASNRLGLYDLVGLLSTPSKDHTSSVDNPPLNLYEPIFNPDGSVNQNNYWASFVYNVVRTYKDYVRIWEVYNEADYPDDGIEPQKWDTEPPIADELPSWNSDVFEFNRIMRVTYEVVKSVDPTAWVAPGGLNEPSFLDAMLRYTDNNVDGSVTSDFPLTGGAYFDCVSFHQYPKFGETDEKSGVVYSGKGSDNLVMKYVTLKKNFEYRLEKYGFDGTTYPRKMFICTGTGVPDKQIDGFGGDLVRRNYMLKQLLYAREYGIKQSHWTTIADCFGEDFFNRLGDFFDITGGNIETAEMKDSSKGRLVWEDLQLSKMDFDEENTAKTRQMLASLSITDSNLTAVVFKPNSITSWPYSPNEILGDQSSFVYVFWRRCDFDAEVDKTVKLPLTMDLPCRVFRYDGSYIDYPRNFEIDVDGTPVFVVPSCDPRKLPSPNHCYHYVCKDDGPELVKRDDAIEWEKKTNDCVVYQCINRTGIVSRSKCISTQSAINVCVDNKCVSGEKNPDKKFIVNITLDLIDKDGLWEVDTAKVVKSICELTGMKADEFEVEIEMDEDGLPLRVVVLLNDKESALNLQESLKDHCHPLPPSSSSTKPVDPSSSAKPVAPSSVPVSSSSMTNIAVLLVIAVAIVALL